MTDNKRDELVAVLNKAHAEWRKARAEWHKACDERDKACAEWEKACDALKEYDNDRS